VEEDAISSEGEDDGESAVRQYHGDERRGCVTATTVVRKKVVTSEDPAIENLKRSTGSAYSRHRQKRELDDITGVQHWGPTSTSNETVTSIPTVSNWERNSVEPELEGDTTGTGSPDRNSPPQRPTEFVSNTGSLTRRECDVGASVELPGKPPIPLDDLYNKFLDEFNVVSRSSSSPIKDETVPLSKSQAGVKKEACDASPPASNSSTNP
jgi:hypothetical protein